MAKSLINPGPRMLKMTCRLTVKLPCSVGFHLHATISGSISWTSRGIETEDTLEYFQQNLVERSPAKASGLSATSSFECRTAKSRSNSCVLGVEYPKPASAVAEVMVAAALIDTSVGKKLQQELKVEHQARR